MYKNICFNEWLERHNLSVPDAGKVLGLSRANSYKIAKGDIPEQPYLINSCEAIDLLPDAARADLFKKRISSPTVH